jgi:hypothetical protein
VPPSTTTTIPFDANNSTCKDKPGDGFGGFDLKTAKIHRPNDHKTYEFTAEGVGPWAGHDVEWRFQLGDGYVVSGFTHADSTTDAEVFDVQADETEPIEDFTINPNSITLSVPNAQIADAVNKTFDWTVELVIDGSTVVDDCSVTGFGTTTP